MFEILFYVFAAVAVVSAVSLIWQRNPVASAISLIVTLACQAGLFVLLGAHFAATMQILVYTGAIMVLFVFVIMLLNLQDHELGAPRYRPYKFIGGGLALLSAVLIGVTILQNQAAAAAPVQESFGTIEAVGMELFSTYLFPFEVLSLVLTAAIAGAVILGKKEL